MKIVESLQSIYSFDPNDELAYDIVTLASMPTTPATRPIWSEQLSEEKKTGGRRQNNVSNSLNSFQKVIELVEEGDDDESGIYSSVSFCEFHEMMKDVNSNIKALGVHFGGINFDNYNDNDNDDITNEKEKKEEVTKKSILSDEVMRLETIDVITDQSLYTESNIEEKERFINELEEKERFIKDSEEKERFISESAEKKERFINELEEKERLMRESEEKERFIRESEEKERFINELDEKKRNHRRKFQKSVVMSKSKLFK